MYFTDFHLHTQYSDGVLKLKDLVDLYGKKGFGAIAVTDHVCETKSFLGRSAHILNKSLNQNNFEAYMADIEAEAARAWELYKMVVIPGVEITKNSLLNHRSAHILALGIRQWICPNQEIEKILEDITIQGGVSVAAHPVDTRKWEAQTYHLWDRRSELRDKFDAWEVASGPHIFKEVQSSGLPLIANSDLHHPRQMNSWKTVCMAERKAEAILADIRKQKIDFKFYEDKKPLPVLPGFWPLGV